MRTIGWFIILIGVVLVSEIGFALYMEYQAERGPTITLHTPIQAG